ncbi:MAG: glycogen-binding domain-containing protein [Gemmatimonadaceae bacterium]
MISAQTAVHFEAGGARVRYGDTINITAGTLSAAASSLTTNASLSGLIAGSTTQESSWTMFAAAQGSVFTPARGLFRGEIHGNGSITTYGAGSGSGQLLGGARAHFTRGNTGAWLGASVGSVKDPIGWRYTNAGEIGGWMQLEQTVAQVVVMPVRIAGGLRHTDVEGTVRFEGARMELVGVAGMRTAIAGYDDSPDPWASVNATAWVLRAVGITAGIGSYPSDLGQDLPAARYATLGVRVSPRSVRRSPTVLSADVLRAEAPITPPALTVADGREGRRTIRFRAGSMAQRVEIMGDFTDWSPVRMNPTQSPGGWTISLPVSSGVHQVNVRLDGGAWVVPEGLTTVRDEFGGSVGILLVP